MGGGTGEDKERKRERIVGCREEQKREVGAGQAVGRANAATMKLR
jgi:hypothetical protein